MKDKLQALLWGTIVVAITYVVMAWFCFSIEHTKAGQGAFYVHFYEIITFKDVPDLKEQKLYNEYHEYMGKIPL